MNESRDPENPSAALLPSGDDLSSNATRTKAPKRALPRRAWGGLKKFARRSALAFSVWGSTEANPFLTRAYRIETRRGKPLWTLAGVAIASGLLFWLTWWAWNLALENMSTLRVTHPMGGLPAALGRHPAGLFAIVTLAASTYAAFFATRARAAYLLRQELFGSTLDALQLLPQPEERWVWWLSAHPTLLSLLIALAGLPVYSLAILVGAWSLRDLLGIALLFVLIGHIAPTWQPQLWQQQAAAKNGKANKFDWKAWQESLKAERAGRDQSTLTPQEVLESHRRTQRAMAGLTQWPATAAPDAATAPTSNDESGGSGDGKIKAGSRNPSGTGWNIGCAPWFWGWLALQGFGGFANVLMRGGAGGLSTFWGNTMEALPPDVTSLVHPSPLAIPILFVNWPLLLSRVLLSPLPFFSFALPPFLVLVPLWIGFRHQWNQSLASQVSARETFWTLRRARLRGNINALLWLLFYFLTFGFGWQTLIDDGGLLPLLRGLPAGITPILDWSQAAAWTLAIVLGTFLAGSQQEKPLQRASSHSGPEPLALQPVWRQATGLALRALSIAIGLYFVGCWLGRSSGVSDVWLSRLAPTLAMALAFILADSGSGALQTAFPAGVRSAVRTFRVLWFGGLAVLTLVLIVYLSVRGATFSFALAPALLLSPYVSLISLFRHDISFPGFLTGAWWGPPIVQGLLGALCWAFAYSIEQKRAPVVEVKVEEGAQTPLDRLIDLALWPLQAIANGARWIALRTMAGFEWIVAQLRRLNDAIVQFAARWQNPVLSDELRRRLNREWWPAQWILLQVSALFIFWLFGEPLVTLAIGAPAVARLGEGTVILTALVMAAGSFFAPLSIGKSFDRERANGQLVFLFLTPLTDREIVHGKLVPGLMHVGALWLLALPWLVLGVLLSTMGGSMTPIIMALAGSLAATANAIFVTCISAALGVRAHKPGEGMAKAGLIVMLAHALILGLMIFTERAFEFSNSFNAFHFVIHATILFALAFASWRWALYSFRLQRYNEEALRGKAAG